MDWVLRLIEYGEGGGGGGTEGSRAGNTVAKVLGVSPPPSSLDMMCREILSALNGEGGGAGGTGRS